MYTVPLMRIWTVYKGREGSVPFYALFLPYIGLSFFAFLFAHFQVPVVDYVDCIKVGF